ncbi:ATP-binding protein [Testudinibacter sp. TR-2022]|uniref:ATP-binding protein n=1 Tax=Testudinibacter sp. TR-2022 TaxID=2585029 RepID=UPI00111843F4|nr:ATP-binding protein [Testudinibacter sp. TR-2022]TNH02452.1 ATP-binding protein [Pasteurellaceae bacterium Phil31]TNH09892.1 ATP-binding protein [Testudinibacter sp. TR-2022]TNH10574.1 ATP-binding protein [Testudinibacter sp. TR-2022]TNH13645.1 ATP-binding protein [Testudinibacter sp. TR-2022]TNH18147.1 ATP-binding protein [Testudinibacter sp. TR-2022]
MLARDHYLQWLIDVKDNEFIKVITGVRRSGKSVILQLYQDYLLAQSVLPQNILFYNFEHPANFRLTDAVVLFDHIQQQTQGLNGKIYFIFDEIQEVNDWQKLVNGLRVAFDADIYITGSNANLLSGELATYLAGRYLELHVYPLSFKEFVDYQQLNHNSASPDLLFNEYLKWGGFPVLPSVQNDAVKKEILNGIYSSIVLKDVAARGNIREINLLERVIAYLLDVIGSSVSIKKIADTINSSGIKTNSTSIDKYIQLLKESFIFYEANRYDIRGKVRLKMQAKYYVVDSGIRNNTLGQIGSIGSQLENIIFIELKRRGYEVFVGKWDAEEIDFVCFKGEQKKYIQVAYQLPENNDREQRNLLHINDNYQKIILTLNRMNVGIIDGIPVQYALDWLLGDD